MKPDQPPPRYSGQPFPGYRFIPGRTPHPTRDPDGHSYGHPGPSLDGFDPDHWRDCGPYLYGVDLYNHGYWWEAHEAWEACWIAAGKQTPAGLFLQGLIQIAAGCLKKYQGYGDAGRRLAFEGLEKFPRGGEFLGIDTTALKSELRGFFEGRRDDQPLIKLDLPAKD